MSNSISFATNMFSVVKSELDQHCKLESVIVAQVIQYSLVYTVQEASTVLVERKTHGSRSVFVTITS